jgi:U3 small nucleolar RNA-associated protein 11
MRNAIQRRSHRERAQPLERKRLGLLEKHKDYSLRAKDWNKKKATLQSLREKAAARNEDEFSYKMITRGSGPGTALSRGSDEKRDRHWTGTVEGDRGNKALSVDAVRLLKTQDMGYLRTVRSVLVKEVAQLEERAALAKAFLGVTDLDEEESEDDEEDYDFSDFDSAPKAKASKSKAAKPRAKPTRIVFAENATERDDLVQNTIVRDNKAAADDNSEERQEKIDNARRLQRRLVKARTRLQVLDQAEHELELQRARMAKTATMDIITKSGRKIKVRERKR